jgi:hypothetical protein
MVNHNLIHFYDAAEPRNLPSGVYACVYANGFTWPHNEVLRMRGVRYVSVARGSHWARTCSIIDIENGAALPEDVVPFVREREAEGHPDATAYVNRGNWPTVKTLVDDAVRAGHIHDCLYWVATLDNTVDIPGAWAVQYMGGGYSRYDVSVLFGHNWFHNPRA